jgi:hypothetical protein
MGIFIATLYPLEYDRPMTPIHDIEAAAVQAALDQLSSIRPDLNGKATLALASLVARTAAAETTMRLSAAGLLRETKADGQSIPDSLPPLILTGLAALSDVIRNAEKAARKV